MAITFAVSVPLMVTLVTFMTLSAAGVGQTLALVAALLPGGLAIVAWIYSPLRLSYGFGAGSDGWAGYWGFNDGVTEVEDAE